MTRTKKIKGGKERRFDGRRKMPQSKETRPKKDIPTFSQVKYKPFT